MAYELTGKVKVIDDKQVFDSGFEKREFVVTVEDGKYPQDIKLECVGDRVDIIAPFGVGCEVTVGFDIRGREYNGRYFNNLNAWRITGEKAAKTEEKPAERKESPVQGEIPYEDDVPF